MKKILATACSTLGVVGLFGSPVFALNRADLLQEMMDGGYYYTSYEIQSENCGSETEFLNTNVSVAILDADTSTGEITDGYLAFGSYSWGDATGTLHKKKGQGYYVLKLSENDPDYGKITFKARVKKNDPTNLYHMRYTIKNYPGSDGDCNVTAKAS